MATVPSLHRRTRAARSAGVPLFLSRFARRQPGLTRRLTAVHAALLRLTRGRLAGRWFGAPVLLLETTGRRTGRTRVTPLVYLPDGEDLIVVPANAGAARGPDWWHNLRAAGAAVAIIGGSRHAVTPYVVDGARRARLWDRFRRVSPLEHYQQSTTRRLDIVALSPVPAVRAVPAALPRRSRPVASLALLPSAS